MMQAIQDYYVAKNAVVLGDVHLGPGANIWFNTVIRGDLAKITLGPRANLQDGCIVHTDFGGDMLIEEGVVVGHAVVLHGKAIGRDCLIGIGSRLLSGSVIGAESIIGAGALIPEGKVIPPRSLVLGMPGKVVREVSDEDLAKIRKINAHYLEMAQRYVRGEFTAPWEKST